MNTTTMRLPLPLGAGVVPVEVSSGVELDGPGKVDVWRDDVGLGAPPAPPHPAVARAASTAIATPIRIASSLAHEHWPALCASGSCIRRGPAVG
ncbi:MAG: hypothetical protein ABJB93_12580, partial [Gaiellales bacterium]